MGSKMTLSLAILLLVGVFSPSLTVKGQLFGGEYVEFVVDSCQIGLSRPDGVSFCFCIFPGRLGCTTRNIDALREAIYGPTTSTLPSTPFRTTTFRTTTVADNEPSTITTVQVTDQDKDGKTENTFLTTTITSTTNSISSENPTFKTEQVQPVTKPETGTRSTTRLESTTNYVEISTKEPFTQGLVTSSDADDIFSTRPRPTLITESTSLPSTENSEITEKSTPYPNTSTSTEESNFNSSPSSSPSQSTIEPITDIRTTTTNSNTDSDSNVSLDDILEENTTVRTSTPFFTTLKDGNDNDNTDNDIDEIITESEENFTTFETTSTSSLISLSTPSHDETEITEVTTNRPTTTWHNPLYIYNSSFYNNHFSASTLYHLINSQLTNHNGNNYYYNHTNPM